MKRVLQKTLIILSFLLLVGCNKDTSNIKKEEKIINTNCKIIDCINLISLDLNINDINEIIGIDGKRSNKDKDEYKWIFSNDETLIVNYENKEKATITIDIPYVRLKDKNITFRNYKDLTQNINNKDGITYSYFKEKVGNIDGILIEKSMFISKYIWVSNDESYLIATFSNGTNKCKKISGIIKNNK